MSHRYLEGKIHHTRFLPKRHSFDYRFFMIDIDLSTLETLENRLFSCGSLNLFSFQAKDHFGSSEKFLENVHGLLKRFAISPTSTMRFITLPRIAGFVFNPISVLLLIDEEAPVKMLAEVHNYNGGRIVYPVTLTQTRKGTYKGEADKAMYVSPFFDSEGRYAFVLSYNQTGASITVELHKEGAKMLTSHFSGKALAFSTSSTFGLFVRHTLLSVWVVTRTLWQTIRLKYKGMVWNSPRPIDQIRRY